MANVKPLDYICLFWKAAGGVSHLDPPLWVPKKMSPKNDHEGNFFVLQIFKLSNEPSCVRLKK